MKKWRVRVKIFENTEVGYRQMESDINDFLDDHPDIVVNDIRLHSSYGVRTIAVITYKEPYYDVEDEDDEA